ncbi:hypothetical protein CH373_02605 [Leptospira perolatii]|uniref:Uncharacterized protein n=1 Tax=Leptospira perolatii TaxID=2023191 RepID=A0A2M9ZSA0_9LEPT|nr:hypothetical protein [Leptospira perolatii]PJZ71408.1 hypothetical protein CH360_02605 [Leptospira perolatii]PJZ74942.1 hypothetical protein CH373_02605 [Leptospira perolatii]
MSELNFYLVPVDEPRRKGRGVGQEIIDYLSKTGILNGIYGDDPGAFSAGEKSADLFNGYEGDAPAFEYMVLYDKSEAQFVPENYSGGFGSRCSKCEEDMDDVLIDFLNDWADDPTDASLESLVCENCGAKNMLTNLKANVATAVTNFYLNFKIVDSFDLNSKILSGLEKIVGAKLKIIEERL